MKAYGKAEIEKFLLAIDRNMSGPFSLLIIGGTAAALAYRVTRFTTDIDTVNRIQAIETAYKAAKLDTGFDIPMGPAGIEDGPRDYESRVIEYPLKGLAHLKVFVPEMHDLVLMKTVRGYSHDIETAVEIHEKNALDFDLLLSRMKEEMTAMTGDKRRILGNFLAMIEAVFGEKVAERAEKALRGWEKR